MLSITLTIKKPNFVKEKLKKNEKCHKYIILKFSRYPYVWGEIMYVVVYVGNLEK